MGPGDSAIMKSGTVYIDLQMLSPTLNSGDWNGLDMYTVCRAPELKKKLMEGRILGGRPEGRPRRRWIDAVCQDAREQLGVRRWRWEAEDRKSWRHLIEEAKVRFGLWCQWKERAREIIGFYIVF
jgi:hypothetical protein